MITFKHNLTKQKIKKLACSLILALAIFSASFVGYHFNPINQNAVEASYKQVVELIDNNEFVNESDSSDPATPSNWTLLNPTATENIASGIINVYPTLFPEYAEDYELETTENPGTTTQGQTYTSDNAFYKHLMINSFEGASRAGYESSSFTLAKSSYYAIKTLVKTTDNARASIYLDGLSDEDTTASITNFTTQGEWQEYTIYIATNSFNAEEVTLQLWLGGNEAGQTSTDAVFFNKTEVLQYSESTYSLELYYDNQSTTSQNQIVVANLNGTVDENPVLNANFETTISGDTNIIDGWKTLYNNVDENQNQTLSVVSTDPYSQLTTDNGIINPFTNNTPDNNNVLFMQNKTENYVGIESSPITILQQSYYKISVWANSDSDLGDGATLKLVQQNPDETDTEFEAIESSISVATTETENATTNNWTEYSFYVEGHPLTDQTVTLQLWLGTEDAQTTGYVFFDNVTLQQIRYEYYSAGSSTDNSETFSFNDNNNQFMVSNGNFNLTNNQEDTPLYPLTPRNWTLVSEDENFDSENSVSGIVNTQTSLFEEFQSNLQNSDNVNLQQVNIINPGLTPILTTPNTSVDTTSNNVLLVGNPIQTTQTFESESITLDSGSYYKFSILVNTQFTQYTQNSGASIQIEGTDYTVYQAQNINTNGAWQTYSVYIAAPTNGTDITISVGLQNATGYVFFDDVQISSITETIFNQAQASVLTNTSIVNYNVENFDNYYHNDSDINTPYTWQGQDQNGNDYTTFGIIDTQNIGDSVALIDYINPYAQYGNNVLTIHNQEDTYYTATSNISYSLESETYYKISVFVKTQGISQEAANTTLDEDDNPYAPGASIKLSSFDESFTAINTELASETNINNWQEYIFYVSPESATTTTIEISLGYDNALTSGIVYVDTVLVETMEEADYTTAVQSIGNSKTQLSLTELATEDDEDTSTDDGFTGNDFNWLTVSSLIMAAALLIAVIGTGIRKINFKPRKRIKTSYDRRKTIELELNKRERIAFRKNIIDDLKQEFDVIDKEIADFISEQDQKLDELKQRNEERRKHYEEVSQAILVQITELETSYKEKAKTLTDNKQIKSLQEKHNKQIAKLQARAEKTKQLGVTKERKAVQLQTKRERYLQQQQYRKQQIEQEIARIEREIEEIAKEEEKIWSDYRKAKEEAKQAKLEYKAGLRAERRKAKENKKQAKQSKDNSKNTK